jgi:hypothetical protein
MIIKSMPTVFLKNGDSIQVNIDELEGYLRTNKNEIKSIKIKRRGAAIDLSGLERNCEK